MSKDSKSNHGTSVLVDVEELRRLRYTKAAYERMVADLEPMYSFNTKLRDIIRDVDSRLRELESVCNSERIGPRRVTTAQLYADEHVHEVGSCSNCPYDRK